MKQQTCKFISEDGTKCLSPFHTAMYHKPRTPLKRTAIKPKNHIAKPSKLIAKPRKKKSPRASAKDSAWNAFSYYIRIRDSLATTGNIYQCVCITCNERGDSEPKDFKHIQAGHAVGGRGNAVLFNEEIVNGQCDFCNTKPPYGLGGDYGNYAIALIKRFGLEHTQALQRLKGTTLVYKTHDFIEIEQRYKEKTQALLQ